MSPGPPRREVTGAQTGCQQPHAAGDVGADTPGRLRRRAHPRTAPGFPAPALIVTVSTCRHCQYPPMAIITVPGGHGTCGEPVEIVCGGLVAAFAARTPCRPLTEPAPAGVPDHDQAPDRGMFGSRP